MNMYIASSFIVYFTILLGIALIGYKRVKNADDYISGNKSLNYWITAIAAQSSDMSSWVFMGLPGAIYVNGLFEGWTIIGLLFFTYLNWKFIAPKIRIASEATNSITLSDYFSKRFNDHSGSLRLLTVIISIIFFTFYISSGLVGMGYFFETVFAIPYNIGMLIGLTITVSYIVIGGLIAIAWCDLFQGIFLLIMISAVPFVALSRIGGWHAIQQAALLRHVPLTLFPASKNFLDAIFLSCGWGLGYFGQAHILINFMGINDVKKMKYARYVGILWQLCILLAALFIGIIGIAYFANGISDPELVFIVMVQNLLAPFTSGLVLCAILAAIITTLDTQILVLASTFTHDFYKQFIKGKSSFSMLTISRMATILFPLMAFFIALYNKATIYDLVKYAWSGLGSSFGPLVLTSLYLPTTTRQGAFAGIITGALVSGLWPFLNSSIPSLIPGFFGSLAMIYLVSGITKK